jgi:PAS domain S-box-containing protein
LRLRTYFGGLIVLFAVAALVGVFYAHEQSAQNAREQGLDEAAFAAQSASNMIGGRAEILRQALNELAGEPQIRTILAHPADCTLGFSPLGAFPAGHIDLLRPDGRVVCSTLLTARKPGSYAGQSWLAAARSAPQVLAPVRDASSGRQVAIFTVPLHGGIAAAFVNLDTIGPNLDLQLTGTKGLIYIVTTADGRRVIARSAAPGRLVGGSIVRTAFYRRRGEAERPDLGGTARLFAEADVPTLGGWKVYAGIDRGVALAAASSLYDRELLIILAALLVVLGATALLQRKIARPIAQLHAAVRRGGEAAGPMVPGTPAEVVDLAAGFDDLVGSLRAAEQEASFTADTYRELFQNHPQPMWIYDGDTLEIFEVNESAVSDYGYSREEFLAMTIRDLCPPQDIPALLESVAQAGPRDGSGPWRHIKQDGTVIEVEVASHEVEFRGRRGRLVVVTDITERQLLQRQLEQVKRLESLGQLAGGVAHDFNNLLGVILNYAAFVREELDYATGEDPQRWTAVRGDVEQIEQAARRATALTHQLLAFARREVIHPEVINLNESVEDTEQLLRRALGEHIELAYSPQDDLWSVLTDPGQVEQILINLAVNSRDAMPNGGRLLIETLNVDVDESYASTRPGLEPGRYVQLRVSDNGQGMAPATLERVFEPFYTTKPKGEGTGLGLATVYGIVTQAGGYIRLYSERGIGTTCTVMLPATAERLEHVSPADDGDLTGHGEVVLVVEDEDGIREVARRVLERGGYEVLTAPGGYEALALARGHHGPIDLLITDVIMPRMMGNELAAEIATLRPATRIMYMSGYAAPLVGASQGLRPDTLLIEKPFTEHTLLVKVREALGAPSAKGAA